MFGADGKHCIFLYLKLPTDFYHRLGSCLYSPTNIDIPYILCRNHLQGCETLSIKCGFFSRITTQIHELEVPMVAYIYSPVTSMPRAETTSNRPTLLFYHLDWNEGAVHFAFIYDGNISL